MIPGRKLRSIYLVRKALMGGKTGTVILFTINQKKQTNKERAGGAGQ